MNDESLKLQIETQIVGFRNHLRYLTEQHRRVETNSRRAMGHAQEAVRLSLKLRRLYARQRTIAEKAAPPATSLDMVKPLD